MVDRVDMAVRKTDQHLLVTDSKPGLEDDRSRTGRRVDCAGRKLAASDERLKVPSVDNILQVLNTTNDSLEMARRAIGWQGCTRYPNNPR